jgi:hypothetical protein
MRSRTSIIVVALVTCLLCILAFTCYNIPPIHDRLAWRIDALRTQIKYFFNPPQDNVFIPSVPQVDVIVQETLQAMIATPTIESDSSTTPLDRSTATPIPTPLPPNINLDGIRYQTQHGNWNYCAPANLTMALSYWGVNLNKLDVGNYLKPDEKNDKNVMPYEMQNFVETNTNLRLIYRMGGDLILLKTLIANGFPVMVERGAAYSHAECSTCDEYWLGHYQIFTGYDEARGLFIAQDSFKQPDYEVPYNILEPAWRSFNYIFIVVYPIDRESELLTVLGPWADNSWANQHALDIALNETQTLSGLEQFFAWFNAGTSYVNLLKYSEAAIAYDNAFSIYAILDKKERPFRILWYQTGPYYAYYQTGRFQDVIDLTTQTLNALSVPALEESYVWRARARAALGDINGAIEDLNLSLKYHPGFQPGLDELRKLGY